MSTKRFCNGCDATFVPLASQKRFARGTITSLNTNIRLPIAASSYLNSAPLVWSFKHGTRRNNVELVEPVPAQCANLLGRGDVHAALIPAIEYQRIDDISLVPSVCVASLAEVRSVILVSKTLHLETVRSVALDRSSRTSATLAKIVFKEFLRTNPTWTIVEPDLRAMLAENDAALIIGDPGMQPIDLDGLTTFDMASLWRRFTNLGFVFALWAIRHDAPQSARQIDFAAARDEGLSLLEEIVEYYQPLLQLSHSELRDYLLKNIIFELNDELRAGLQLFYELAYKHELVPALKPLKL